MEQRLRTQLANFQDQQFIPKLPQQYVFERRLSQGFEDLFRRGKDPAHPEAIVIKGGSAHNSDASSIGSVSSDEEQDPRELNGYIFRQALRFRRHSTPASFIPSGAFSQVHHLDSRFTTVIGSNSDDSDEEQVPRTATRRRASFSGLARAVTASSHRKRSLPSILSSDEEEEESEQQGDDEESLRDELEQADQFFADKSDPVYTAIKQRVQAAERRLSLSSAGDAESAAAAACGLTMKPPTKRKDKTRHHHRSTTTTTTNKLAGHNHSSKPDEEAESGYSSPDLEEVYEFDRRYLEEKRRKELEELSRQWHEMKLADEEPKAEREIRFPPEILAMIFDALEDFEPSMLYVCRDWYSVGVERLYREPKLTSSNFATFVEAISKSAVRGPGRLKTQHKDLGQLVKVLDLRNIIQSGKNSYVSKVLRRCSSSLQVFIAPQTSFGYAPLVSLKSCARLRTLDLSLVSETVDLRVLFMAIANTQQLERLDFPRSSVFCEQYEHDWPENLWNLGLSGGISNEFLHRTKFPATITHLTVSHCPFVQSEPLRQLFQRLGPHLESLRVLYPMPALRPNTLDSVLKLCPKLRSLTVSIDYVSRYFLSPVNLQYNAFGNVIPHPLKFLTMESTGMLGQSHKIDADDISLAILDDIVPNLTHVRVSCRLGWNANAEEMQELAEILEDQGGGVWIYSQLT
ncbi:hypothetical protein TRVA0_001S01640 [Trichomonascus vanleenenianus]|uniref:Pfu1p n=1 Tax=Trichomonascus vanleenenianus TaxID=2268995 RepID=UPI003ECA25FD